MKKRMQIGLILIPLLCLLAGCKADTQGTVNSAYTPVQGSRTMTYDAATDRTTLTNGEMTLQLLGQWEEKDDCYTSTVYGFVNLVQYNGIVTVYDYTNEYSSSANWSIAGKESQLTITPLSDKTTYGFHINSETATYQFIYTSNSDTEASASTALIATVLQTCKFQAPSSETK